MSDRIVLTVNGKVLLDTGAGTPVIPDITPPPVVPVVPPPPPPPYTPPPTGNPDVELVAPGGHPIRNAGGDKIYNMPNVQAGETIEVSVQGGFSNETTGVLITIHDPSGAVMVNNRNGIAGPELLFNGYGIVTFVAPLAGNYTVEMHGGGDMTTLNHFRR